MAKQYIQPAVQVTPFVTLFLMQAASPVSGSNQLHPGIETDDQW